MRYQNNAGTLIRRKEESFRLVEQLTFRRGTEDRPELTDSLPSAWPCQSPYQPCRQPFYYLLISRSLIKGRDRCVPSIAT
jgi:hypothetical protein